jgi:N6-L-threonylcarbamoyladenine synthase
MDIYFLAVETSCDDTSVSVLRAKEDKGKPFDKAQGEPSVRLKKIEALSNVVSSQTEIHKGYGGVYPFLAKREHKKNLPVVFEQATKKFDLSKIKFVGVTVGPGLDPCLWTGINFAQDLAKKYNLPLVGANHLEAHFLANLLTLKIGEEKFTKDYLPAVCLVVSGGHTILFLANAIGDYKLLGQTVDDAAGECFDKAARILGLGYPGGSEIARYAKQYLTGVRLLPTGRSRTPAKLPRPMINQKNYNFSFSGLKTAVLYFHQAQSPETQKSKEYLQMMAYEIQQAIVDVLVSKTMRAAKEFAVQSIIIGGGVAANETLRKEMKKTAKKLKIRFLAPAPELSVDNAAMAGVSTYFAWRQGKAVSNPDSLQSEPNLSI